MSFKADQFRPGQVLGARVLTNFFTELERLGRIHATAPITFADETTGLNFGLGGSEIWWIKLTSGGTGGKYAWTRQQGVVGGTWEDHAGGEAGTTADDPAVESTGKTDVATGTTAVHKAWRDPISRTLFFTAGTC